MQEGYGDFLGYSVLIVPSFAIVEGEGLLFFLRSPPLTFYFFTLGVSPNLPEIFLQRGTHARVFTSSIHL